MNNKNKITDSDKKTLFKLFDTIKGVGKETIDYTLKNNKKNPDVWLKIDKGVSDEFVKLNKAPRISKKGEIYIGISLELKNLHKQLNNLRTASKLYFEPSKLLNKAVKFYNENNYPGKVKNISADGINGSLNKALEKRFGFKLSAKDLSSVHSKVKELDKNNSLKR